jgi:hypothetical protein
MREEESSAFLKKSAQKTFDCFPSGDVAKARVKVANVLCGAFFQKSDRFFFR